MVLTGIIRVLLLVFVLIGVPLWIIPSDMNPEPNIIMILIWIAAAIFAFMPFNVDKND